MFETALAYLMDNLPLCVACALSIFSTFCSLLTRKSGKKADIVQEDLEKLIEYHEGVANALKKNLNKKE